MRVPPHPPSSKPGVDPKKVVTTTPPIEGISSFFKCGQGGSRGGGGGSFDCFHEKMSVLGVFLIKSKILLKNDTCDV